MRWPMGHYTALMWPGCTVKSLACICCSPPVIRVDIFLLDYAWRVKKRKHNWQRTISRREEERAQPWQLSRLNEKWKCPKDSEVWIGGKRKGHKRVNEECKEIGCFRHFGAKAYWKWTWFSYQVLELQTTRGFRSSNIQENRSAKKLPCTLPQFILDLEKSLPLLLQVNCSR